MTGERRLTSIKALMESTTIHTEIVNVPLVTHEQQIALTLTTTAVSVSSSSTLVLAANPNRKYLMIQRGTTVGRVFVKLGTGTATGTNGILFRENACFILCDNLIYQGEINAITVGSNKLLYITEGQ